MNAVISTLTNALRPLVATLAVAVVTAGLALVATSPASATGGATATSRAMSFSSGAYEDRVQHFVNKRRAKHGLGRLSFDSCADGTAENWAQRLAARNEFFHQSMGDVLDRCRAFYAGETLGKGAISPHRLVYLWMHSPAHRAVLLSKHAKRIGVGAYVDASGAWVTAANFTRY